MNEAIYELLGQEVEVRSNSGDDDCCDSGVLEAYDHPWIRLRKSEKEVLCFPVYNVRLVKVIRWRHKPEPRPDHEVLLRPTAVGNAEEESTLVQGRIGS